MSCAVPVIVVSSSGQARTSTMRSSRSGRSTRCQNTSGDSRVPERKAAERTHSGSISGMSSKTRSSRISVPGSSP